MSGVWRTNEFDSPRYSGHSTNEYNFYTEDLKFQSYGGYELQTDDSYVSKNQNAGYFDQGTPLQQQQFYDPYSPSSSVPYGTSSCEDEEPPLLEELGIVPERIVEKTLTVLNPFNYRRSIGADLLKETDLAGPLAYCILLGVCLLLAGGKAHFGYVYGLVMISCPLMFFLLNLMTNESSITIGTVSSVLGYCLIPLVVLSVFGVFWPLYNMVGLVFSILAVLWSSFSASSLFVTMSGDAQQRPLIAYPCALLYGTFALIIVF